MSEPMQTYVEGYGFAADSTGLYLVSGKWIPHPNPPPDKPDKKVWQPGPWRSTLPVMGDSNPGFDLELLLAMNGVGPDEVVVKDQTSDRWGDPDLVGQVDTFAVVLRVAGLVQERWEQAREIRVQKLLDAVGRPEPHTADQFAATIRDFDVLLHALRHLAFQRLYDLPKFEAMPQRLRHHLAKVTPALAGLYQQRVADAA